MFRNKIATIGHPIYQRKRTTIKVSSNNNVFSRDNRKIVNRTPPPPLNTTLSKRFQNQIALKLLTEKAALPL